MLEKTTYQFKKEILGIIIFKILYYLIITALSLEPIDTLFNSNLDSESNIIKEFPC